MKNRSEAQTVFSPKRYFGLHGAASAWLLGKLAAQYSQLVVICKDRRSSERLKPDLSFFCPAKNLIYFPPWDTLPLEPVSPQIDISAERLFALRSLQTAAEYLCITSVDAICQRVVQPETIKQQCFKLARGQKLGKESLIVRLNSVGYQKVSLVEEIGQFAVRGGVIDLAPAGHKQPLRLEFDGERIDSIRYFEFESQRSCGAGPDFEVVPVREFVSFSKHSAFRQMLPQALALLKARCQELELPLRQVSELSAALENDLLLPGIELLQATALAPLASFFEFLSGNSLIVIEDEISFYQNLDSQIENISGREEHLRQEQIFSPRPEQLYLTVQQVTDSLTKYQRVYLDALQLYQDDLPDTDEAINIKSLSNHKLLTRLKTKVGTGQALAPLAEQIALWRQAGWQVVFVVGSEQRATRLQKLLLDIEIAARIFLEERINWQGKPKLAPVVILPGQLSEGFQLPGERLAFVAENEIFLEKSQRHSTKRSKSLKRLLSSLAQLREGDYVVHSDYGIGIYQGLKHLSVEGLSSDFLQIDYSDSKLFLPVTNISKVQKFSAAEGQQPSIDRLGSNRWIKTKERVRESVLALAGDLIKLYAARTLVPGWRFEPLGAEDERFADGFPFSETEDQLSAIEATLADMAQDKPMDRLICGDVGFGKTEVALRAAFKCTQHARQVALLAPTTVLVEQHKQTFLNRFLGYPVRIEAVSRFYPAKKNKETLADLADGKIDIIIGTHRLLQRDVNFADLGLLIVDEEHRFGVKQKEKLKQLRKSIDVLTLTATPIPRTLHMALLDIRDISVITSPPHDRKVIRTYISNFNEILVKDAIERELQRGGQCFFLHNRVDSIAAVSARLAALVPSARFAFGHGQMTEEQLEQIMRRFLAGEIDVLVCTTIIESGLDIPNANTIIIDRADTFGLAQLYQLRGRVGRSKQQAYAYLIVPDRRKLGDEAQRRLKALQALDDLGQGFNLAVRDLEIRGAGNLLGREQSGNVVAVGFELYTKILKEAVLNLKGSEIELEEQLDPEIKICADAFIPDYFIPDVSERLVLYQRLAAIKSDQEAIELSEEIEDRFGGLPAETRQLIEIMRFRAKLRHFGVIKAELSEESTVLSFSPRAPIDGERVLALVNKSNGNVRFRKSLVLTIRDHNGSGPKDALNRFRSLERLLDEISLFQLQRSVSSLQPGQEQRQ